MSRRFQFAPVFCLSCFLTVPSLGWSAEGIQVGAPKTYDDFSLQLMLRNARNRLVALQAINKTGITGAIGRTAGATVNRLSLGVQALGPSTPARKVRTEGNLVDDSHAEVIPSVVDGPTPTAGLPTSGIGVAAADVLNEMMQLEAQIMGLQLLMEGALSDRYYQVNISGKAGPSSFAKKTVTLGFDISVSPPDRSKYKYAAAEVEVSVRSGNEMLSACAPSIKTLLPQEKTYNVATITDKGGEVGAGAILGVINAGGSFLWSKKRYFIVQAQDVLAFHNGVDSSERRTGTCESAQSSIAADDGDWRKFSWQFRPVLGQKFVRPGLRQVFVQLAFPVKPDSFEIGELKVVTRWRKVNRKTGAMGPQIAERNHSGQQMSLQALSYPIVNLETVRAPGLVRVTRAGYTRYRTEVQGDYPPRSLCTFGRQVLSRRIDQLDSGASCPLVRHGRRTIGSISSISFRPQ